MAKLCPLLKKPCIEHECAWYHHLIGMDPQTGAMKDVWDCNQNLMITLAIENSKETVGVHAAIDKMHNGFQAAAANSLLVRAGEVLAASDAKLIDHAG